MPIYEFYSPDTHRIYSFFARSLSMGQKTPKCPDRDGARMERMVSSFAVTGRAKEKPDAGLPPDDPRMERVMAEMERELATMDDANPDPKTIGRMMRKMTEATGQPLPAEMEHMIRRLEAGDDPERLEEEFGDVLEKMDLPEGDMPETQEAAQSIRKTLRRPSRDPKLYEMADFI